MSSEKGRSSNTSGSPWGKQSFSYPEGVSCRAFQVFRFICIFLSFMLPPYIHSLIKHCRSSNSVHNYIKILFVWAFLLTLSWTAAHKTRWKSLTTIIHPVTSRSFFAVFYPHMCIQSVTWMGREQQISQRQWTFSQWHTHCIFQKSKPLEDS